MSNCHGTGYREASIARRARAISVEVRNVQPEMRQSRTTPNPQVSSVEAAERVLIIVGA
ncbi:hypothetical protein [Haladaptatus halobius]|uniref:hypothetical protein n=1 Tax=Haladaptatus halobius TaxID=2884875 RepID=UPI001D0A3994|nr:hypothetical protein [Haladaptatus halobius]